MDNSWLTSHEQISAPPMAEKIVLTKSDLPMQYVTLEDETGLVEAVVFSARSAAGARASRSARWSQQWGVGDSQDGAVILQWL